MRILRRCNPLRKRNLAKLKAIRRWDQDAFWQYEQSVLALIGAMNAEWATITLMLNSFIEWYFRRVGRVIKTGRGRDFPRDFTAKLRYLEQMEPDIRWTPDQRAKLRSIRLKLADLNQFRKTIVHGSMHRKNRRTFTWQVHIAKEEKGGLKRSSVSYTNADIAGYAQAMSDVSAEMSPFFAGIIGLKPTKR